MHKLDMHASWIQKQRKIWWNWEGPAFSFKAACKMLQCYCEQLVTGLRGIQATGKKKKKIDPAENPYVSNINPGQDRTGAGTQPGSSWLLNTSPCCNFKTFLAASVPFGLTVSVAGHGYLVLWWKKVISWSHPLFLTNRKPANQGKVFNRSFEWIWFLFNK